MNKLKLSIVFTMLFCVVFTHAQSSGGNGTLTNNDESIEYTILDSSGGNSNELAANLFDGNPSTKWCSVSFTNKQEGATVGGAFVIFKTSLPMVPTHYTMTTAGDTNWYPQRNWKQWQLYGMNADSDEDVTRTSGNWLPLDKKYNVGTDQLPATNNTSVEFSLSEVNATAFKYFKIEIDEIVSGGTMQMADFLLSGIFTYIPFSDANVKSICVSNWDTDGDGKLSFGEVTAVTTLGEVFKNNNPIHIEIGMGKGRFLMDMASLHPDINYVGIEKYSSVLLRAIQKQEQILLPNVIFIRMDAEVITEVFAPGEVDRIYLNFSDPWPKDRHAKRRLPSREFLKRYDKILVPDGVVEFKTDNKDLFGFAMEEVEPAGWTLDAVTHDLHNDPVLNEGNIMTEYEERFSSLGHPICKYIIQKTD